MDTLALATGLSNDNTCVFCRWVDCTSLYLKLIRHLSIYYLLLISLHYHPRLSTQKNRQVAPCHLLCAATKGDSALAVSSGFSNHNDLGALGSVLAVLMRGLHTAMALTHPRDGCAVVRYFLPAGVLRSGQRTLNARARVVRAPRFSFHVWLGAR